MKSQWLIGRFSEKGIIFFSTDNKLVILNENQDGSYRCIFSDSDCENLKYYFIDNPDFLMNPVSPVVNARAAMLTDGSCIFLCNPKKTDFCEHEEFKRKGVKFHTFTADGLRLLSPDLLALKIENRLDIMSIHKDRTKYKCLASILPPEGAEKEELHSAQCQIKDGQLVVSMIWQTKRKEGVIDITKSIALKEFDSQILMKNCPLWLTAMPHMYKTGCLIPNTQYSMRIVADHPGNTTSIYITDIQTHLTSKLPSPTHLQFAGITAEGFLCFSNSWQTSSVKMFFKRDLKTHVVVEKLYSFADGSKFSSDLITHLQDKHRLHTDLGKIAAQYAWEPSLIEVKTQEAPAISPVVSTISELKSKRAQSSFSHASSPHTLLSGTVSSTRSQVQASALVLSKRTTYLREQKR